MTIKHEIQQELEQTRVRFLALVNSIPESDYPLPSKNSAWTIGDVLFHITLGPRALSSEIWMIVHMRGLFQFGVKFFPSKLFNQVNTRFARRGERVSRQSLTKAYGKAHAAIRSRLRRTREVDFSKSIIYPTEFISDLSGEVSTERLFRYVKTHFEIHAEQLGDQV
jgi:hypothetical protein